MTTSSPYPPAGFFRRMAAIFYDGILLFSLLFVAAIPVVVLYEKFTGQPLYGQPAYYPFMLYLYGIAFVYFGLPWVRTGQTPGMKIWGIRLESTNQRPIDWITALKRFIVAMISWLVFGAGFLAILMSRDKLAWHDLASGTRVVRTGARA